MYNDETGAAITNIYGEAQQRLRRLDALIADGGPYESYNLGSAAPSSWRNTMNG